jgi:hypothetical protein
MSYVLLPEVVPPLRDAVSLVHNKVSQLIKFY